MFLPGSAAVKHSCGCNEANWLDQVKIDKSGVGNLALFDYTFTGSAYGRTGTRMSEKLNTATRAAYSYDPLYRLTQERISTSGSDPTGTITYDSSSGYLDASGFDKVGNRRSRASIGTVAMRVPSVPSYAYDNDDRLDNDIMPSTPSTYFDANGNTVSIDGYAYTYDFENRLVARNGSPALSFAYDHDGNRISKTVGGATTYFLVDEQNPTGYPQVVEELSAIGPNPTVTKTYTYGLRLISQCVPGDGVQHYGHDGHGNIRLLLDSGGGVSQTYTYDAFGILTAPSSLPAGNIYLFAGEQFDPDLGLYYNRARYYSPDKGRFWTEDNFEGDQDDPPSLHGYVYCHADPVNGNDASGNDFVSVLTAIDGLGTLARLASTEVSLVIKSTPRRPAKVWKWTLQSNSASSAGLVWYFSMIFQYRITDQFGDPVVGALVTERISVTASKRLAIAKPRTGSSTTDKNGIVRDNHIWSFWSPAGWVRTQQTISVGNSSATFDETDYANGGLNYDPIAIFK